MTDTAPSVAGIHQHERTQASPASTVGSHAAEHGCSHPSVTLVFATAVVVRVTGMKITGVVVDDEGTSPEHRSALCAECGEELWGTPFAARAQQVADAQVWPEWQLGLP